MFLKNRNIIFKMKIPKVTDYAALTVFFAFLLYFSFTIFFPFYYFFSFQQYFSFFQYFSFLPIFFLMSLIPRKVAFNLKAHSSPLSYRDQQESEIWMYRPLVKSAYPKNNFLISQANHMLWVLKITVSDGSFEHPKQMLKRTGKKIFTILRSKILLI